MRTPSRSSRTQDAGPKRALGRGLSALIPQAGSNASTQAGVSKLAITAIKADTHNPRRRFDDALLTELAESIRTQGVLQPVLVRKDGAHYRLIAGERRWRASQLAGLTEIPAVVRDATPAQAFEMALVENLQRADLDPIEEAEGYKRLIDEHRLTQEQVSQRVGKDRSSVANALRLLGLPQDVKRLVAEGTLAMGHARALLGVPRVSELSELAKRVATEKLSVRDTERLVQEVRGTRSKGKGKAAAAAAAPGKPAKQSAAVRAVIDDLQRRLGTRVRLKEGVGGRGTLEVDYFSHEDLDRILSLIRRER
ncbi:MAG TPA: ParB/RepB/Spo0J family partition protein [Myxococcaceae bacterium]|nr:ParB/RepB/Spo0J family partition protein [Myxococcaceae bacterium]